MARRECVGRGRGARRTAHLGSRRSTTWRDEGRTRVSRTKGEKRMREGDQDFSLQINTTQHNTTQHNTTQEAGRKDDQENSRRACNKPWWQKRCCGDRHRPPRLLLVKARCLLRSPSKPLQNPSPRPFKGPSFDPRGTSRAGRPRSTPHRQRKDPDHRLYHPRRSFQALPFFPSLSISFHLFCDASRSVSVD